MRYAEWTRRFADWIDPTTNPSLAFGHHFDLNSLLASSTKSLEYYSRGVPDLGELPV